MLEVPFQMIFSDGAPLPVEAGERMLLGIENRDLPAVDGNRVIHLQIDRQLVIHPVIVWRERNPVQSRDRPSEASRPGGTPMDFAVATLPFVYSTVRTAVYRPSGAVFMPDLSLPSHVIEAGTARCR